MIRARIVIPVFVGVVILLIVLLARAPRTTTPANHGSVSLTVYCAAGLKPPVELVARAYERAFGASIQLQYGGSGTLLSNLRVANKGDLFIAGDESYLATARSNRLVQEILPLATMRPVIAVQKGNPKKVRSISDLSRVGIALANPEAAAIGRISRDLLRQTGQWDELAKGARVFKPTVNDIANDIKLGTVDAGIIWDSTARQYPELEMITVPAFATGEQRVCVGVLTASEKPAAALRFARYLAARDGGLPEFARLGYQPVEGDAWEEIPELVLFSGGVNRVAIEETLQRFERREGVRITRVYNGCGILVSQMKAGQRPDAYFACDTSFMRDVSSLFNTPTNLSQTQLVLLLPKGNPKGIRTLADLAAPGLRIGLANEAQSALGALTARLLRKEQLFDRVMANVRVQTPTADLLVNQMRTGSLDAVVVYSASTSQVRETFTIVPVSGDGAIAIQPFAVGNNSRHRYLAERLLDALNSPESRAKFEASGFQWWSTGPEG